MMLERGMRRLGWFGLLATALGVVGCESYPFLTKTTGSAGTGVFATRDPFVENLVQERTFTDGSSVRTRTFLTEDMQRAPYAVDFNGDGKVDPVVGYGGSVGVIQLLLSQGGAGKVDYVSLTFDGGGGWDELADVAVGDIDGDGALDIVAATEKGVVFLHHPKDRTTILREWGDPEPDNEFLAGSTTTLTNQEIQAILTDAVPPTVNIADYDVTLKQGYTRVEVADFDNDGAADIVASRRFSMTLSPKSTSNAEPISIVSGELQVFLNPGEGATNGQGWQLLTVGRHERFNSLDRPGANGLMAIDMDGDGDLDLVSAAGQDNNVQVAWFENPDGPGELVASDTWTQWRIGSVRDAYSIDIADLTGDGNPDVVVTGRNQMQLVLFEHPGGSIQDPDTRDRFEFDWDSYVLVTFESYQPLDVKVVDVDNDGKAEIVVGGTNGAIRYFESAPNVRDEWTGVIAMDFAALGNVGLLGYGDLDGDKDIDLVAVLADPSEELNSRVSWIRNDLQ
ncbi:MAG: VCBS repeat-containing protein [Phycisphaerales bacterium]|nr:VCBS repeat-containing protein [Phycisphaerales bacterium]